MFQLRPSFAGVAKKSRHLLASEVKQISEDPDLAVLNCLDKGFLHDSPEIFNKVVDCRSKFSPLTAGTLVSRLGLLSHDLYSSVQFPALCSLIGGHRRQRTDTSGHQTRGRDFVVDGQCLGHCGGSFFG